MLDTTAHKKIVVLTYRELSSASGFWSYVDLRIAGDLCPQYICTEANLAKKTIHGT